MTIGERIRKGRLESGLSQGALSKACGWQGGARISNYEQDIREPNSHDIIVIAKALKTTPSWLFFGEDERKDILKLENGLLLIQNIPILPLERVNDWLQGVSTKNYSCMSVVISPEELVIGKKAFFIEITGDSMCSTNNPAESYYPNDYALVEPDVTPHNGDTVLISEDEILRVRQLMKDGTEVILKPLNPQYPIIKLSDHVKILGVILITQRKRTQYHNLSSSKQAQIQN